ncbi:MAG: PVC-type heme-binding CxxCH protein [Isosphaeraceae bacterium]
MTRRTLLAITLALSTGIALSRGDDEDLASELPRIPGKSPAEAIKSFQVQKGFHVEPIATEPLLTDPVHVCQDADGALYVVEMRGYPYPEDTPSGNVRRLVDTDGDGRFDASTIFVDGLSWPTSVVASEGGVFIAVPPEIIYARDTDGDGVADLKRTAFSGFGTQNVQALVNGLLWGPDGWIYGVGGGNGGEIKNHLHPDAKPVSIRGRDFRFKPDGSAFEAISGGGQFGHAFDDWGHRFTSNNSNHIRQIILPSWSMERNPALVTGAVLDDIAVEGAAAPVYRISALEPWRIVRTRQRAADPVMRKRLPPTELVPGGFFTSATGVTIYRGDAYPPEYRGNAFIGDVGGNLVHRKILSKNGAHFDATRADEKVEFLASTDNWFRPVNFFNTPNGTLLILDMYRETIEHPFSIPEPIKKHLDLTSGKDRGRLYELLPPGPARKRQPRLAGASTGELVATLADPASWWRETAQRLLIERNDKAAIGPLRTMVQERPTALGRTHALWTLDALDALDEKDLAPAFADAEPGVREQAAKLAERLLKTATPALRAAVLGLAEDPDPMVRFQVAIALGALPRSDDPAIERPTLDALATIALRDARDRWTRYAVQSSLAGRSWSFLDHLAQRAPKFLATPEGRPWLEDLTLLVGVENRPDDVAAVLARFARPEVEPTVTRAALLGLGRGLQRGGGSLRQATSGPAGSTLGLVFARAAESARTGNASLEGRVEAVRLLSLGPVDLAMETLPGLLDARQPVALQLAALQTLAALNDRRVAPAILGQWRSLSPAVRGEAVEALFARTERLDALLDAVESKSLTASDLDPGRIKILLDHPKAALKDRAGRLFGDANGSSRAAVVETFRPALAMTGDRDRGREVFRKVCATCHRAEGQGAEVGPNLATVTGRTPEDLLIHVLDPNREVAPNYVNYNVETVDGRILSGLIAEESANAVTLKRAEGATDVVPRDRIEAIVSTGRSVMPEGLEQGLTSQDLADLLAFVRGIQSGGQTAVR